MGTEVDHRSFFYPIFLLALIIILVYTEFNYPNTNKYFLCLVCDNPGGEDCIEEESATTTNKRLQRMKVQSRKTFKFRKTRKREREVMNEIKNLAGIP